MVLFDGLPVVDSSLRLRLINIYPDSCRKKENFKMADMKDLIKSAIQEVNSQSKSFQSNFIDGSKFIETLPDDCTYHVKELSGVQGKFKAVIQTKEVTIDNLDGWLAEYGAMNIIMRIKTKGCALKNYYRCHHNTRNWSPSKDPQKKLLLNRSARVKKTNCPFQVFVKIACNGCCTIEINWDHNQSIEALEASNFNDISLEVINQVMKLFVRGCTPSTARQQCLQDLRESCKDELEFHKK